MVIRLSARARAIPARSPKYYCGTETAAAFKHVAEHIMHKRDPDRPV